MLKAKWNPKGPLGKAQFYAERRGEGKNYWGCKGAVKMWDKEIEITIMKKNPELSDELCATKALELISETLNNAQWKD